MAKSIRSTPKADQNIKNINQYLREKWGNKVANTFLDRLEDVLNKISETPEIYPSIAVELAIKKCVVTKHNTLYFREEKDFIYIIAIFDTRQNPNKLDQFLK